MGQQKKLSVVVGLFGRYEQLVNQLDELVNELKALPKEIEKIIVADGPQWSYSPLYQLMDVIVSNVKIVTIEEETHLPAKVFRIGLENSLGEYILFHHLMCGKISDNVHTFLNYKDESKKEVLYIKNTNYGEVQIEPPLENLYGYLLSSRIVSLNDVIVRKDVIENIEVLNTSIILQKDFDRLLMIKLAQHYIFEIIGADYHTIYSLKQYPFNKHYNFSRDIVERYINYNTNIHVEMNENLENNDSFIKDINSDYLNRFPDVSNNMKIKCKYDKKYKITILGGYWEYHHNQVVFFNYFQRLSGQGFCTYKTLFDFLTTIDDIRDSDLVIFTRCRSENIIHLIDYCNENKIATMYMIDDNWISIAKDYPDLYGNLFVEGNPNYDNFIMAIKKCKTTLVYSDLIKEDIMPYAKHITKFYISIEPKFFEVKDKRVKNNKEIYVGFAGSLRWQDEPFKALSKIAKKYKQVKVFFMGVLSKEQKEYFQEIDFIEIPFSNYSTYAKNISELNPDLILAPLVNNRTNKSKCYNKYVEMGVVSAVCIYSKQQPYTEVVEDNINGFYVRGGTERDWYERLEEIVCDVDLLRSAQKNAYEDVINNHTVNVLLNRFADMITNVIEEDVE